MIKWKHKFEINTLERGREIYLNKRVVDFMETSTGYKAAVLSRERFEVSIKVEDYEPGRMSCSCPATRMGRNCEHMAAVLYAAEAKLTAEDMKITEAMLMQQWKDTDADIRKEQEKDNPKNTRRRRTRQEIAWEAEQKRKLAEEKRQKKVAEKAEKERRQAEELEAEKRRLLEEKTILEKLIEEEKARIEAEKIKIEAEKRQRAERDEKRLAREKRKAEMAKREAERKRLAEEARQKELEKIRAEEERRRKIREQKEEEARRREEKRRKEQEAQKETERRRKEEEILRQKQEQKRKEKELLRQKKEKEQEEEFQRQAEARRRQEETMRKEQELKEQKIKEKNAEFELLGTSWSDAADVVDMDDIDTRIRELERYNYFDGTRIRNYMKIPKTAYDEGRKLFQKGMLEPKTIETRLDEYRQEMRGEMTAVGREGKREFVIRASFNRTMMIDVHCGCSSCRDDYYSRYSNKTSCPYKAGLVEKLEEYLNTHNLGDITDRDALNFMAFYQKRRVNQLEAEKESSKMKLTLLPRLARKDGDLSLSFKVGEGKLFVVKKLDDFYRNVKNSATDTYGSSTEINHNIENFSEKGKEWIQYLSRIVREELEFQRRIIESNNYYMYRKMSVGGSIHLFGQRLDDFYKILGDEAIEFEDKDAYEKKKGTLTCKKDNPKVTMHISAEKMTGSKDFHGIRVDGKIPDMYRGSDTAYYISEKHLNQVEPEFLKKIEPLANLSEEGNFSFCIGRNHMSEFYNRVLPQFQDIVDVTETEPEKFRKYLLPEVRFLFYLDAENQNVTCRAYALYGNKEYSLLDSIHRFKETSPEAFRDIGREQEVLQQLLLLMPKIDWEKEEFHCDGDEDLVYQMLEEGTQRLMEIGEVRCTQRFRGTHKVKRVKVSVGVSVASGLLELDIATDDVSHKELLDILNSYRTKKKYYRLKDGSFVNTEDSSLEMLSELMDSMHLKPKELIQGKMHLPMYRTLYLDKMLEENEEVYSNRDSRFREIVKGFKTVKDADFEEPESLAKIMRKYQKDGYKWLRTLEAWQFGGILADDMGLGKTLQVIAVLLAAKQEGKEGTSLIVVPASLVFNWGEEFRRFAPELKVTLVTGTQEERKGKIDTYQESDVLVTSYDLLKRDIAYYEDKQFSYEIIDEAQYIKNHTTAAAKAVKVVKSQIRYALTGTPIENRLSELWSIFDYLMPGFLYGYDTFKKEIETPVIKGNDEDAMKRLQKMVGPFILRRLKEDVLKDLPEKLEEYRYVQFENKQRQLYDAQVVHMRETLARQNEDEFNKNKLQILAELTRLRQICCAPSLCFENYTGETAKLGVCMQLIQSAIDGGHRMLVFSQFTSMLEILQKSLDETGISYYTITGSTAKEKRLQMVKEFNEGDIPVFLISLKAGGVGLNLTGADMVIHYDPWWNQAAQNQATDRAHRIGQKKKVTVYKLIVKNTIEEKIQELQEKKRDLAEQVIAGETGQLGALSRQEIMELLKI